jgi:hypothetical protein
MRPSLLSLLTLTLTPLALACSSPGVANLAASEVVVTVTGVATAPEVAALGESQGGLGVSRVFVSSSSFRLLPCDSSAADITLEPRGYDLLAKAVPREAVGTLVTDWCGLQLDIDPVARNTTEGVPEGASLYVEGTDADGAAFALTSEASTSVLLEAIAGVSFGDVPLLLGLDVSAWLEGVALAPELAEMSSEQLVERLPVALALYADANENQSLDEDETTPVAVVP